MQRKEIPFKALILPVINYKYIEIQLSQVPEDIYSYILSLCYYLDYKIVFPSCKQGEIVLAVWTWFLISVKHLCERQEDNTNPFKYCQESLCLLSDLEFKRYETE